MTRLTSAALAPTCPACSEKSSSNTNPEPCLRHAALAQGYRIAGWQARVPSAWENYLPAGARAMPADSAEVPDAWGIK